MQQSRVLSHDSEHSEFTDWETQARLIDNKKCDTYNPHDGTSTRSTNSNCVLLLYRITPFVDYYSTVLVTVQFNNRECI
jgi:hypothetical protein